MKIANKKLNEKLFLYTNDFEGELFLDIEDKTILDIIAKMNQFGLRFPSVRSILYMHP